MFGNQLSQTTRYRQSQDSQQPSQRQLQRQLPKSTMLVQVPNTSVNGSQPVTFGAAGISKNWAIKFELANAKDSKLIKSSGIRNPELNKTFAVRGAKTMLSQMKVNTSQQKIDDFQNSRL
ncbi:Hypothetical_protein [Hexamita inflata]|uniref:Hypothetical_protein n=1 Tax=Hexamita inflata TaxID=28002 RepID=A0AA86URV0_9EUKA|nr:Hypothetical protein HINF_LOCUS53279 [Hexamita inflata]